MGATYSRADAASPSSAATAATAAAAAAAASSSSSSSSSSPASPAADAKPAPLGAFSSGLASATSSTSDHTSSTSTGPWWRNFDRSDLPNPGSYDEIAQDGQLILRPNLIEGLSFNFNAPVSDSFTLGSAVDLGAKDRPGQFAFLANYFTNRLVMLSRTTPADGRVNGRIFINHTPALTSKIIADIGPQPNSSKGSWDLDYRVSDACAQLKYTSGSIVALTYMQSVTPWLALGGEGFVQTKANFSAITFAAKFSHGKDSASLSVATFGPVVAQYVHRINPRVAFATELFVDGRTRDSHAMFGYRFDLKSATVIGLVDSSGRVAATLEEKINPALSLTLSGELDHWKQDYKFGFGVNIGGG